jgi:sorbitol/mannitol transport system permease protein
MPLLPALGVTILLTQLPFALTVVYSLQSWNLFRPGERGFAGLENYRRVFSDAVFRTAVWNTVSMTVAAVLASLLLGLLLAVLLDRAFPGRALARTLVITPFLVMPAAASLVWKTSILDPNFGVLNWALGLVGLEHTEWLGRYPFLSVVMIVVWQWTPFMMLILLAGLQSQSTEILDAARVDGAGPRAIFVHMTLPHLRPFIELSVILGSIYILQVYDQVFLATQGGPGTATTTLPFFLYLRTFRSGDIGYASALGVVVVVATIIIATLALRVLASLFRAEFKTS